MAANHSGLPKFLPWPPEATKPTTRLSVYGVPHANTDAGGIKLRGQVCARAHPAPVLFLDFVPLYDAVTED